MTRVPPRTKALVTGLVIGLGSAACDAQATPPAKTIQIVGTVTSYRSIGTDTGVLYSAGDASITGGSSTVTFASATLPADIGAGDALVMGSVTFEEAVDGGHLNTSPVTMPVIQGGTGQTYVLFISTRNHQNVTGVTGGGCRLESPHPPRFTYPICWYRSER